MSDFPGETFAALREVYEIKLSLVRRELEIAERAANTLRKQLDDSRATLRIDGAFDKWFEETHPNYEPPPKTREKTWPPKAEFTTKPEETP